MITTHWLIQGLLLPFVIAAVAVLLSALLHWRQPGSSLIAIGAAVGGAIACLVGDRATGGWPNVPPVDPGEWWRIVPNDWLTVVLIPAAAVCTLLAALPGRGPAASAAWVARLIVAVALIPLLTQVKIMYDWPTLWAAVQVLDGPIVAMIIAWLALATLARTQPAATLPLSLTLTAATAGVMIAMASSLVIGQMALSLAAALAGIAGVGLAWPGRHGAVGAVDVGLVALVGVLTIGVTQAQLAMLDALLLGAAPLAAWVGMLPIVRDWRPSRRAGVQLAAVAIVLAIVVVPEALAYEMPV